MPTYRVALYGIAWDTEVDGELLDANEQGLPVNTSVLVDAETSEEALQEAEDLETERFGFCMAGYDNYHVEEVKDAA